LPLADTIIAGLRQGSYGKIGAMAAKSRTTKSKAKRFRVVEAVKALARERIGAPPASKVVPNRKKKTGEKHKPTLGKLLDEN
jgi:hypothetical protein